MPKSNYFSIILTLSLMLMMGQSFLFAFPSIETRSFQSYGPGQEGMRGEKGYQSLHKILGDLALASRPRYGKRSVSFPRSWIHALQQQQQQQPQPLFEDQLSQLRLAAELDNLFAPSSSLLSSSSSSSQVPLDPSLEKRSTEKV